MSGLGSFIKGAFEGYEYGENVKDRKTQRKRNEKRWEWEQENQDWKRENNEWAQENRDWTRTQRERQREQWERQEAERERMADIYDESRDSFENGQQTPPPGQVETPGNGQTQPTERGVTDDAPTRPQARPRTVAPQPSVSSEGPMQPSAPNASGQPPQMGGGGGTHTRKGRPIDNDEQGQRRSPAQPTAPNVPPRGVSDQTTTPATPRDSTQANDVTRTSMAVDYSAPPEILRLARETDGLEKALRTGVYPNSGNQPLREDDRRMFAQMIAENDKQFTSWANNVAAQDPSARYASNQLQTNNIAKDQAVRGSRATIRQQPVAPGQGSGQDANPTSSPDANNRVGSTQRTAPAPPQKPVSPSQSSQGVSSKTPSQPDAKTASPSENVRQVDEDASAFRQDIQRYMRRGDVAAGLERIQIALRQGVHGQSARPATQFFSNIGDYFTKTPEEGKAADVERARASAAHEWFQSDDAFSVFSANPALLDQAAQDPIGFAERYSSGSNDAPPQKPGAPGSAPVVGNLDVRQASTDELDQQATQNPPDKGGAPSVESAGVAMEETASTSKGVVGPGTKKVNPKDEERASKNFLDHYAKTAVPKIVDYYLSQGNVEKAQAFETWAKSRKVKGQMESWSKAIWAITNGDEDRFIDHISDTYNAIDDGLSIDREKSKFIHDEQGNIIGGQLAVVNDETGEVSIQNFDDQQDIVEMAIYTLAPEQTFEYLYKMSQQAREMRIEAAKGDGGVDRFKLAQEVRREAERLSEGNALKPDGGRLTEEQIQNMARENVYRRLGVSTGASTGQGGGGGGNAQEPPRL